MDCSWQGERWEYHDNRLGEPKFENSTCKRQTRDTLGKEEL